MELWKYTFGMNQSSIILYLDRRLIFCLLKDHIIWIKVIAKLSFRIHSAQQLRWLSLAQYSNQSFQKELFLKSSLIMVNLHFLLHFHLIHFFNPHFLIFLLNNNNAWMSDFKIKLRLIYIQIVKDLLVLW
jgi:hypothetical protein